MWFLSLDYRYPGVQCRVAKIPGNAVESRFRRSFDVSHHFAVAVLNRKHDRGIVFTLFINHRFKACKLDALVLCLKFLLCFPAGVFAGL